MTAPEGHSLQLIFALLLLLPGSYVVGRIHQWYTNSLQRDTAFRQGYDQASHTMFDLAVREHATLPPVPPTVAPPVVPPRRRSADVHTRTLRRPPLPTALVAIEPARTAEQPRTRPLPQVRTPVRGRRRHGSSPR